MTLIFYQNTYLTRSPNRGKCGVIILPPYDEITLTFVQDNYLDAYLQVVKKTDPLKTSLVFSCGMGAVRTTFAMTAASLVRRRQLILRGMEDPYGIKGISTPSVVNSSGANTVMLSVIVQVSSISYSSTWRISSRRTRTQYVFIFRIFGGSIADRFGG